MVVALKQKFLNFYLQHKSAERPANFNLYIYMHNKFINCPVGTEMPREINVCSETDQNVYREAVLQSYGKLRNHNIYRNLQGSTDPASAD